MKPKDVIEKHKILESEQADIALIEGSSAWQKMRRRSEEQGDRSVYDFAFAELPAEPMAMLGFFLDLRARVQAHYMLGKLFEAVKQQNIGELNLLLGKPGEEVPREDTDLDAGTQIY